MTAHQQSKLNELAQEFMSVSPRPDSHSLSVYVDCYDVSLPEMCVACGRDEFDHLGWSHWNPKWPNVENVEQHAFKVAVPVATFRVSPSGFKQRIDPVETAA